MWAPRIMPASLSPNIAPQAFAGAGGCVAAEACPLAPLEAKRPAFYGRRTSRDVEMGRTGQIGGEDCLFFCYQNYCSHFSRHKECLFCNLVSTSNTYDSVLRRKDTDDIGEVAAAAFSEGMVKHVLLTGGCFSHQKEIERGSKMLESIRR